MLLIISPGRPWANPQEAPPLLKLWATKVAGLKPASARRDLNLLRKVPYSSGRQLWPELCQSAGPTLRGAGSLVKTSSSADTGHSGWFSNHGRGHTKVLSLYWLVLDQRKATRSPGWRGLEVGVKSLLVRCLCAAKPVREGGKTLLFRSRQKNMTRQAAQTALSRLEYHLRWALIRRRRSGVTGSFLKTSDPSSLRSPLRMVVACQLLSKGLGRSASRLIRRRTAKYWRTKL